MKTNASRFAKGSAVYVCRVCKRATRQTGRNDNEHAQLCAQCYDLAGEENHLLDTGELMSVGGCQHAFDVLKSIGVNANFLFPEIALALANGGKEV